MIRVEIDRRWRVRLTTEFELPLDAPSAWLSLRDFRRFACQDIFHRKLELESAQPHAGAAFALEHGLLGLRVVRVGRVLYWHEGSSYAFSDLSRRGPRKGFPHIYTYRLTPVDDARCRFRLEVRGLWTLRSLGRPLIRLWLGWILLKTTTSIRNAFLADAIAQRSVAHAPARSRS